MIHVRNKRNESGKAVVIITLVITIAIVATVLWFQKKNETMVQKTDSTVHSVARVHDNSNLEDDTSKSEDMHAETSEQTPTEQPDMEKIKALQKQAADAAALAEPIEGTVSNRPDFVSEIEWDVFQEVANNKENSDKLLTHFVNKMLYYKKWDAWNAMLESDTNKEKRHTVARQLLEMLPVQIREKAIGEEKGKEMKQALMNDLQGNG